MYEGMKKQVIAKVTKQIDKEVSDSRSDIMGLCLKKDDFTLNEYLDSLFFKYFKKYSFYKTDDSYQSMINNKIPTWQFIKFSTLQEIQRTVPRYIKKAKLELRYVSYYYKHHYSRLVQELKSKE
jgi:hypothetical protein